MVNALAHKIEIADRQTVETVADLRDALAKMGDNLMSDNLHDDLDSTYVVERLEEYLIDGSIACSLRIRLAEAV